jgi:hypothetical protein
MANSFSTNTSLNIIEECIDDDGANSLHAEVELWMAILNTLIGLAQCVFKVDCRSVAQQEYCKDQANRRSIIQFSLPFVFCASTMQAVKREQSPLQVCLSMKTPIRTGSSLQGNSSN